MIANANSTTCNLKEVNADPRCLCQDVKFFEMMAHCIQDVCNSTEKFGGFAPSLLPFPPKPLLWLWRSTGFAMPHFRPSTIRPCFLQLKLVRVYWRNQNQEWSKAQTLTERPTATMLEYNGRCSSCPMGTQCYKL
jgi:hypothetical protein